MSSPTLYLSGLSRADEASLRALLEQAQSQLQPPWRLVAEAEADTLLIDMDSMYGQMALMKALGSGKTLIALTEGARADTPFLLRRPFDVNDLAQVLNAAAAASLLVDEHAPLPAASAPVVLPELAPAPTPAPPPAPVNAPEPAPVIAELAIAPEPAPAADPAPIAAAAPSPTGGLDPDAHYKLDRWPQIDRAYPKHFRIATLMLKGPARLGDIAEATGASVAEVAEFVQAKLASGHASRS